MKYPILLKNLSIFLIFLLNYLFLTFYCLTFAAVNCGYALQRQV